MLVRDTEISVVNGNFWQREHVYVCKAIFSTQIIDERKGIRAMVSIKGGKMGARIRQYGEQVFPPIKPRWIQVYATKSAGTVDLDISTVQIIWMSPSEVETR